MSPLIATAGYATAIVDFTTDFSALFVGLIGLTALSAAMIVMDAVRYNIAQKSAAIPDAVPVEFEYKQAA